MRDALAIFIMTFIICAWYFPESAGRQAKQFIIAFEKGWNQVQQ